MAVPKRKTSKQRKRIRRSHLHLTMPSLTPCPRCGAQSMPHRVCHQCGYYRSLEQVVVDKKD